MNVGVTAPWTPPAGTRGLIFDCDGTLADTMPLHHRAWVAMLTPHGIRFPVALFYQLGGMPTAQIIAVLSRETGVPVADVAGMVHAKESAFLELLHEVAPIAEVVAVAEVYRGRLPMAVASGGYRAVVLRTLTKIGVGDWFAAVVCAEDTARHKPEPDVFLEAARRLGVPPETCVVFEDTDIGLDAARRAGMGAVDVRAWRV